MKKSIRLLLTAAAFALAIFAFVPAALTRANASTVTASAHTEQYRSQLAYSQNAHWNNDPNGLLYIPDASGDGGTYHMYYQYAPANNRWSDMSWGHATSTDLVHWQEHSAAINPNFDAGNDKPTGTIFSGSAVYVSSENASRAYAGEGVYAIFTQPNRNPEEGVGDQRQTIAHSTDMGETFDVSTFREIIPNNFDGESRGDFRDPKVSWNETLGKWMMVVGGGEILQFVSDDLETWENIGTTGYWGECPDLFPIATPADLVSTYGATTWVLVMSPEDKTESHEYNGTDRLTHEYPSEYYALGSLDENGLFVPFEKKLERLSLGIDCYAIQTFNDVPNGRRLGVSWAASWKTVNDYAHDGEGGLRSNWNGGFTMIYELGLKEVNGALALTRSPVSEYESLRSGAALYDNASATIGTDNILGSVKASLAEVDVTLDLASTSATEVTLSLAASAYEHTDIIYNIADETLTVDRSESSLAAKDTSRYRVPYTAALRPVDNKVRIRAWLDLGGVFVSAGSGEVSGNIAIFPSLYSNGMSLVADADVNASVKVYALNGIWDNSEAFDALDDFYVSATSDGIVIYPGEEATILAGTPDPDFDLSGLTVAKDGDNITAEKRADGSVAVSASAAGSGSVTLSCGGKQHEIPVTVYNGVVDSDAAFVNPYAGSWRRDGGYVGASGEDGFIYTDEVYRNFRLTATVDSVSDGAAAFGIMFAAGDTFHTFYCANYDYNAQQVKLWMSGGESIMTYPLALRRGDPVHYDLTVKNGDITIVVNGVTTVVTSHNLYESGHIGLNVYNGSFRFDNVRLYGVYTAGETVSEPVGDKRFMLRNDTAGTYLTSADYTVENGMMSLTPAYTASLVGGKTYEFSMRLEDGSARSFTLDVFSPVQIYDSYRVLGAGEDLAVALTVGTATVGGVLIDGKPVEYTFADSQLTVAAAVIEALGEGDHTLTVLTSAGAGEFVFGFKIVPPPPVKHTGMIISIIAAAAVLVVLAGFLIFWFTAHRHATAK